jgi:hypothetical protein
MKPLVIAFFIASPSAGINRLSENIPAGYEIHEIIADVPAGSTVDILDTSTSIFGPRPVGGGTFATANKRLRFPEPYICKTNTLELQVNLPETVNRPISVSIVGAYPEG